MTISSTTAPKVQYNGDDSTTAFSTSFVFVSSGDLEVYLDDTLQTITTHYTVSGGGTPAASGTVTMVTAPASGEVLTIVRNTGRTQGTDYVENDAFPAESHESALDRLTLIAQEVDNKFARTVLQSVTTTAENVVLPAPEANKYLQWNSGGTNLQNTAISASGIADILEDTTPQLGGNLDVNGNDITSPDGTDLIDITDGAIDIQTNSSSRLDLSDSGVRLGGANARVTTILDEDAMGSDSATSLATQQSIKAYVDTQVAGAGGGNTWEFISSSSVGSTVTTIDTTGLTGYDEHLLVYEGITADTANFNLTLTFAISGTTYLTDGYMYTSQRQTSTAITNGSNQASMPIQPVNVSGGISRMEIRIIHGDASNFAVIKTMVSAYNAQNSTLGNYVTKLEGGNSSASADRRSSIAAVRINVSAADTVSNGTVKVYGYNYPTS